MTETVDFLGQECVLLKNSALSLLVTKSVGPRILSLRFSGGDNLLAELPEFVAECPGHGMFHFYGGHRLWHAPEEIVSTYLPDDSPVEIIPVENGLLATQDVEIETGLQKSIEIRLRGNAPQVEIVHRLVNRSPQPVTCAPWAITQFKTGGMAVLPQNTEQTGVLPNRSVAFWPYADPSNSNIRWGKNYILIHADMHEPFKIGFPNPRGWMGYWLNETLFVKRAKYNAQAAYFDFGSSSECYCNDQFLELETLAPIGVIQPGALAEHVETWELYGQVECPRDEEQMRELALRLGLE